MKSGAPHTKPEVFILESLTLDDERQGRKDGLLLHRALKLFGKAPRYFYFRTERELEELADVFIASRYRYLHISCHGSESSIATTFDEISYRRFALIFENALNNKRLFASACEVGNERFADEIRATNRGLYSVLAPNSVITFNRSAIFWSAFYFLMFDGDAHAMKLSALKDRVSQISKLFGASIFLAWNRAHENKVGVFEFNSNGVVSRDTVKHIEEP